MDSQTCIWSRGSRSFARRRKKAVTSDGARIQHSQHFHFFQARSEEKNQSSCGACIANEVAIVQSLCKVVAEVMRSECAEKDVDDR